MKLSLPEDWFIRALEREQAADEHTGMDNRIFNVNGKGGPMLAEALALAFKQESINTRCEAWVFSQKHGLILLWHAEKGAHPMPAPMLAHECVPFVMSWLKSPQADTVEKTGWDADTQHDGSNSDGWRVYCEDWGHVAENHYAICAVKPVKLWHGK